MKHKAKNDNLKKHQQALVERNTALIKRVIEHIKQLDGEITMSIVSKVSYEIADSKKGEKGITLAGISKNKVYRALVEEAAASARMGEKQNRRGRPPKHYSDGDIRMMLHALRTENALLKRENTILSQQLKEVPNAIEATEPVPDMIIREYNGVKNAARSMVSRLCEMELTYIDSETECLKVAHYNEVVVPKEALKLFYQKELHDIQRKIRETAPDN
ncbi:hypothetical protein ACM66Z_10910 [Sulfurovum sp. ST-21]|uniref:Uncharacterized protein n=1 Tax=Sulfurovum indicum TaxID=2779528 RepID=A0A7M1S194_9BACT|nr:hypothetical protein [Sulfurovum indicum]QOR61168.1 hypothetical protein IMZ28_06810 [Sulfurovum indicum]QOR61904.1 hypothetical protein IMZ28_10895 [Sulfurovum indicum]